jgi:ABC-type Fe3+-hydroxamate transport system substrate-binding protein
MRIVSLVPSLTLTLFDFGLDATSIVGRTPWCIHPAASVNDVPVVGGTKTPTLSKIEAAQPDLVVMDKDENPKAVYEWCLEQGYATFVCDVRHPSEVPNMLRALGEAVQCSKVAESFACSIESTLEEVPEMQAKRALPLIWHKPLMAANGTTYAGNMLTCLGYEVPNIEPDGTGYPEVSPQIMAEHGITDIFLSSEPHEFTIEEGEAMEAAFQGIMDKPPIIHFIDGEDLTWMGSHTDVALRRLRKHINRT